MKAPHSKDLMVSFLSVLCILGSLIVMFQQLYIMGLRDVLAGNAKSVCFFNVTESQKILKAKELFHEMMIESSNSYAKATILEKMMVPMKENMESSRIRFEKMERFCRQHHIGVEEKAISGSGNNGNPTPVAVRLSEPTTITPPASLQSELSPPPPAAPPLPSRKRLPND